MATYDDEDSSEEISWQDIRLFLTVLGHFLDHLAVRLAFFYSLHILTQMLVNVK